MLVRFPGIEYLLKFQMASLDALEDPATAALQAIPFGIGHLATGPIKKFAGPLLKDLGEASPRRFEAAADRVSTTERLRGAWLRQYYDTPEGQAEFARRQTARRMGPNGSYDFVDPRTGVRFVNGEPQFTGITHDVIIEPTGSPRKDRIAALQKMGLDPKAEKRNEHRIHHHGDHGRMQRVPTDQHETIHTGGSYIWGNYPRRRVK